jgi:hypothetical protein
VSPKGKPQVKRSHPDFAETVPFTPPQQNTNPAASANQAAAVGQATGTSAGNVQSAVSSVQQAFSAVPNLDFSWDSV